MDAETENLVGHNAANGQLLSYIERIERLEEEISELRGDVKDVKAEAKANGFDPKTITTIVRLRKIDKQARQEQEALLETYMTAIGML